MFTLGERWRLPQRPQKRSRAPIGALQFQQRRRRGMKRIIALALVLLGAGCAGYDGGNLVPGQSTAADVEKAMGPSKDKRAGPDGETVLWFPRLPAGRVSYAARIGKDDRLISVEQRLTKENLARIKPGASHENDVRDVLGPPYRVDKYPRRERNSWSYQAMGIEPQLIVVDFSYDGVVREAYMIDDPEARSRRE
jgi:hypothetical protein